MSDVAGVSELKPSNIPRLKTCLNTEHRTFEKSAHKEVLDHHEESSLNQFLQFAHDGTTLLKT